MNISLEYILDSPIPYTFRIAFHSAAHRCLLPYPSVTGLTFTDQSGSILSEWKTLFLTNEPLDDFVLTSDARISFDLYAKINGDSIADKWSIELPAGDFNVHFDYCVGRDEDWYDFLAKRSRFVAETPIWRGSLQSNTIPFHLDIH